MFADPAILASIRLEVSFSRIGGWDISIRHLVAEVSVSETNIVVTVNS